MPSESSRALGRLRVAGGEGLEHAEEVLDAVGRPVPWRKFADRHMQRARYRPPDRLIRPGLDLAGSPQPPDSHRPERVEQHRLPDAPQPGQHHAALGPTTGDALEHHLELADLTIATGELRRALPSAWSIGIAYRVHIIGLYGRI